MERVVVHRKIKHNLRHLRRERWVVVVLALVSALVSALVLALVLAAAVAAVECLTFPNWLGTVPVR